MKSHRRMHAKTNAIITLNVLTESACVRQDTPGMDWIVAVSTVKPLVRGQSCDKETPKQWSFRKWSLPFLGQKTEQQNVSILKKEKNRTPGSNSDLSYSNLSPLPLVYYSDTQPSKSRKRLLHNLANCLS